MKTKKILYVILTLTSFAAKAADSLEVRIKLKSVNNVLTFNQTFVPAGAMEYTWAVLIDSDNNPTTGNTVGYGGNTGFDVALGISHFNPGGAGSQTGSIVSNNTQKDTWILSGSQSSSAHTIRAFIDYTDSSVVMRGSTAFPELANVAAGNRYVAYTYYYSSTGNVTDLSSVSTIPSSISDPLNDVTANFIDIKEVTIHFLNTTGIEEIDLSNSVIVFPNPSQSNGQINITSANNIDEVKIIDVLGQIIYQTKSNQKNILLNIEKAGIYFVTITSDKKTITKKIIVNR
jgi:hypothetical protein